MTIRSRIRHEVTRAGNALDSTASKGADALADVIETVGNAAGDGLHRLGRGLPVGGPVFFWVGGITSAAADFIGSVAKGIGAVLGGMLSGAIRLVGALSILEPRMAVEGLRALAFGVTGGLVLVLGKAVALVQVALGIGRTRPMTDEERRLVAPVFHRSIATFNVRVVDGSAGVFSLNDRPFVLGNVIYMKGRAVPQASKLFVHECVHVWQNQQVGARYTVEALASQFWGVGYDWEREADAGKEWEAFEREAQAELIADVFALGAAEGGGRGRGAFFTQLDEARRSFRCRGVDRTALANAATRVPQSCIPWRVSSLIERPPD